MIKKILLGVAAILVLLVAYFMLRPAKSPAKTTRFSDNGLDISVNYSQPSKRGRLIFGEEKDGALQPYGKYWRLGANAATEITFSKNILFAGQPVSAGSYRMYAVPGPASFQFSLNSELGVNFTAASEPDYTKDVLKVDLPVTAIPEVEQFVIVFGADSAGVNMDFNWDKVQVRVPIKVQ
jgi:hypothetical protein